MKAYRLIELKLERPITIIADDYDHASAIVIQALTRGFGRLPEMEWIVGEWNTASSADREARAAEGLCVTGEPGIMVERDFYWDTEDPFEDF
jgi:hypothetical protein